MDAANGVLRSGATARTGAISITFFVQAMTAPILNNPPAMLGGTQSFIPIVRVMNSLGSTANNGHFVFFLNGLNNMKLQVSFSYLYPNRFRNAHLFQLWVGNDPINSGTMDTAIQATNPNTTLNNLRSVRDSHNTNLPLWIFIHI